MLYSGVVTRVVIIYMMGMVEELERAKLGV